MDRETLISALENEKNDSLMNYTSKKLANESKQMLEELHIAETEINVLLKKLYHYRYIDELNILDEGRYIRWIDLKDAGNIMLNTGAILCKIQFHDDGVYLLCKTFKSKCFQIKFEEVLVFMKLSQQERVILSALDYLS